MSYASNRTFELWSDFVKRKIEIKYSPGIKLFSIQNYTKGFFENFNPNAEFTKYAAIVVNQQSIIPSGWVDFTIESGEYAVFGYKGSGIDAADAFKYILQDWLPNSGFQLDNRPHFEILGDNYRINNPNSEEEIWIPIMK
jgi:AraC family transcriptional regulator